MQVPGKQLLSIKCQILKGDRFNVLVMFQKDDQIIVIIYISEEKNFCLKRVIL